jgi:hypothetical protein
VRKWVLGGTAETSDAPEQLNCDIKKKSFRRRGKCYEHLRNRYHNKSDRWIDARICTGRGRLRTILPRGAVLRRRRRLCTRRSKVHAGMRRKVPTKKGQAQINDRARRFPPRWSVEEQAACFVVRDWRSSSNSDRRPTLSGAVSASRRLMWFRCS